MQIPYEAINEFYLETLVPSLHPILQKLALDRRILRHEDDNLPLETTEGLYQSQYSHVPWMLYDFFPVPDDALMTIGKAWFLLVIDIVITDHFVDRQLPDLSAITLFQQHIRLQSERLFREVMQDANWFWQQYYDSIQANLNAIAHESYCVDEHHLAYTLEEMRKVYHDKSALIRLLTAAMASLCGKTDYVEAICQFYEQLSLADQLLDDSMDWEGDFVQGRYTLPVVMALEAAQMNLEDAKALNPKQLERLLAKHGILQKITEISSDLLGSARAAVATVPSADARLARVIDERLAIAAHARKRYEALGFLTCFLQALSRDKETQ
jgi:hypothetical protein